ALAAEHADDDLGWTPADDAQELLLAEVEANHLAIPDRIDTQQRGWDAKRVRHAPCGRSRPEDVDPAVPHALGDLSRDCVQCLVLARRRTTLCILCKATFEGAARKTIQLCRERAGTNRILVEVHDFGIAQQRAWTASEEQRSEVTRVGRGRAKDSRMHLHARAHTQHRHLMPA